MGNSSSHRETQYFEPTELDLVQHSLSRLNLDNDSLFFTSPSGEQRVRREARQHIRSRLLGSTEDLQATGTRHSSLSSDSAAQNAHSTLKTDSSASDGSDFEAALAIIKQLKQTASPEQLAILQKTILSIADEGSSSTSSLSTSPVPLKEASSSDYSMTRRRSFFSTPGVASRDKKSCKKAPPSPKTKSAHQTWSPEMFGSSPLSRIAGWESRNDGQAELARANTPDASTSFLGVHQLGSLRIMNGAASPEPSILEARPRTTDSAESNRQDDYYTASEGSGRNTPARIDLHAGGTSTKAHVPELQQVPCVVVQDTDLADDDSDTAHHRDDTIKPRLKNNRIASSSVQYSTEANANPFLPESRGIESSPPQLTQEPSDYFGTMPHRRRDIVSSKETSYVSEDQPVDHPQQEQGGSGTLHHLTDGFAVAPGVLSASSSVYSKAPNRKPVGSRRSREGRRTNADSGYVSGASLTGEDSNESYAPSAHPAENSIESSGDYEVSPLAMDEEVDTEHAAKNLISSNVEALETRRACDTPRAARVEGVTQESNTLSVPERSSTIIHAPSQSPSSVTNSEGLSPAVVTPRKSPASYFDPQPGSSNSQSSTPGLSPGQRIAGRKLQKRRPLSERYNSGPIVVQTAVSDRNNYDGLPRVPSKISKRHSNRMTEYPDMDALERTYKSVSHSNSRDSLFSEVDGISIHFPSPPQSPTAKPQQTKDRRSSWTRRLSWNRSRKSTEVRRPLDESDDEDSGAPTGVGDLGVVAASLGTSPYDMAMSAGSLRNDQGELREATLLMHPHQLGGYPRKRVGMNDEQASAFALSRSRDRHGHADHKDQEKMARHRRVTQRTRHSSASADDEPRQSLDTTSQSHDVFNDTDDETDAELRPHLSQDVPPQQANERALDADSALTDDDDDDVENDAPLQQESHLITESPIDEEDHPNSWEDSARQWRARRQDIEGSAPSQEDQGPVDVDDDYDNPFTTMSPLRQMSEDMYPMHFDSPCDRMAPLLPDIPARMDSPSPSVRERADAYEDAVELKQPPMPGRRPPSPPKLMTSLSNGATMASPGVESPSTYLRYY